MNCDWYLKEPGEWGDRLLLTHSGLWSRLCDLSVFHWANGDNWAQVFLLVMIKQGWYVKHRFGSQKDSGLNLSRATQQLGDYVCNLKSFLKIFPRFTF